MKAYLDLIGRLMRDGRIRSDRTGVGTVSLFAEQVRFDLGQGFPLLAAKHTSFKNIAVELAFFLRGLTNASWMESQGVNIWKRWGDQTTRELGPIYGAQWRSWVAARIVNGAFEQREINQLAEVVKQIALNPFSRRHLVSAWNVADLEEMALPPCHYAFQFYVTTSSHLNLVVSMRSSDAFLGLPYNIASYALLDHLVAHICHLKPGELVLNLADAHLYLNHWDAAKDMLDREPRRLPHLSIRSGFNALEDFVHGDCALAGYEPHPAINVPVAI